MVIDHISNASQYFGMSEGINVALQYLIETDFSKLESGRYIIDGDKLFAIVQEYDTKTLEKSVLEAHKEYIDIQFMIEGEECIGYEPMKDQEIEVPYNEKDDYWLFRGNPVLLKYTKGMFCILFPKDLHMPRVISGKSMPVRKVVMKVRI
ncbi:MAG: YhcH/YjgK/YiaL family protein [Mangrovibacterium sp.]